MARDEKHEPFGESAKEDKAPQRTELLNDFYFRKQRAKDNKFACDTEAEVAPRDRDADQAENFKDPDAGPMNTPWARERYGRSG